MTTEFELSCATCGGDLTRRTVSGDVLGVDIAETVPVAECVDCGGWYVPERTLDRVQ
ncbi:hypothetical protein SAMN06269185_0866 [Natronoarchaeum philippinense]|uniref:YgiT-type zinc finger domain-containing protein n=1 Tax=Natronoarchaeum philippinense TaxID=558529 RepID=A0A285N7K7_NATPI|nr:hypothetical protein [Natronoarchaeum philippinense]SNZ05464.1 hypothetical protein SAMN06269185_0866 [Natronoarchaeum philippinense]